MKLEYSEAPLRCGCGEEAIGEYDLYTGDAQIEPGGYLFGLPVYHADSPILSDPHFFPATALCASCLVFRVPPVVGPVYQTTVGVQA
jgi:hypothetical protein